MLEIKVLKLICEFLYVLVANYLMGIGIKRVFTLTEINDPIKCLPRKSVRNPIVSETFFSDSFSDRKDFSVSHI